MMAAQKNYSVLQKHLTRVRIDKEAEGLGLPLTFMGWGFAPGLNKTSPTSHTVMTPHGCCDCCSSTQVMQPKFPTRGYFRYLKKKKKKGASMRPALPQCLQGKSSLEVRGVSGGGWVSVNV